jgi:hypothetical protein
MPGDKTLTLQKRHGDANTLNSDQPPDWRCMDSNQAGGQGHKISWEEGLQQPLADLHNPLSLGDMKATIHWCVLTDCVNMSTLSSTRVSQTWHFLSVEA